MSYFKFKTMKNFKFINLIALFVIFISSCSKERSNIIGEWAISDIVTTNEIPKEHQAAYKESMDDYKASYLLVIKADSTFDHTISQTTDKGKWKLSPDSKQLILTYENGETEKSDIIELSSSKMVTSINVNGAKNTITFVKKPKK
jgi:hypothetical protein